MTPRFNSVLKCRSLIVGAFLCILSLPNAIAQTPQTRITQPIVESQRVTLAGHVHPLAKAKYDQGAVDESVATGRMMMLLSRTEVQQAALDKLADEQQTPGSANYHRWLTPEEFGAQFGASDADVQKVTAWLASQGFTVEKVAASKTLIEFSGTAAQVKNAFQTEIHSYALPKGTYTANNSDPQIPAALAPVVRGFVSLNNFPRRSFAKVHGTAVRNTNGAIRPQWTSTSGGFFAIGPGDFATIYNSMPLLYSNVDGTGRTIGVVGQSNISLTDVANFRSLFGLSASTPTVVVSGTDPGLQLSAGDEGESVMDVEWAGATAPGATIKLVIAKTTSTTSGVDLAAQYLVNNNLADILSESYGACEAELLTSGNSFYKNLWQQAAAQGITVVVATGDNGSAACEDPTSASASETNYGGVGVSGIASTPYNVAVGGTDFNDASSTGSYWSSTNYTDSTTGQKHISALGYIPETTWNDSCAHSATSTSLTSCAGVTSTDSSTYGTLQLWAGSGGPSNCATSTVSGSNINCTAGYSKPSWQTGTGVPNDGVRDIPDVSLFAATGESGSNSFYVACQADAKGDCVAGSSGTVSFLGVSGTSASTPNFAAIIALAGQQLGNQRLGNVNPLLYQTAAQSGASCTSSGAVSSTCTFYDTRVGNISVPCNPGSPDCSVSTGTAKGVLVANSVPAYMTTAGYDTATGLGSVNVTNLVAAIAGLATPAIATPTASPTTVNLGNSATLSVTVTGNSSLGAPTGTITFKDGSTSIGSASSTSVSGNTLTGTRTYTPSTAGTHSITATISSAGGYVGGTSSALTLTVTSLPTPTISTPTATPSSFTLGNPTTLTVTVTGDSTIGAPTGVIKFYDGNTLIGTATNSSPSSYVLEGTYTFTPSSSGTHTVTAQYSGDTNYGSVTSGSGTVTANAAFTQSLTSSSISVGSSGGTGTNTVTFSPASTGVPSGTTISFYCSSSSTAASCTPTSSSSGSVSISTAAVTGNITYTVPALGASAKPSERTMPWKLGGGLLFAGVFIFAVPGIRKHRQLAVMILLLSALALTLGCGGGGTSASSQSSGTTTITPQTYTFTVTATTTAYGVTTTQTSAFTVTN